jgi:fatty acid desaturase
MTTIDYSNESAFWNVVSIGLNAQTIHHLFPTIHSCHYIAIFPIIRDICKKHKVVYQMKKNYAEAFRDYVALVPVGEAPRSSD